MELGWQPPIDHHGVRHVAEQVEVRVGTLGLFDDHLLQVQHDAHRRDLRIGQDLAHAAGVGSISWRADPGGAPNLAPAVVAAGPSSMLKGSPSGCAGSVLMPTVRYRAAAQRTAGAAATDVLPTPPLPVKRTTLTGEVYG